jgi:carbamoyl-phosphate synthase large subunit
MNVLFLGGGRRFSLAKRFINEGFQVFSYELTSCVPVSINSTIIKGKPWGDPLIEQDLINTIKTYNIDIVIPLQDEGIITCAKLKNFYSSSSSPTFLTSELPSAEICFNKKSLEQYATCYFPEIYPIPDLSYPKFCKPIFGFSSKNLSVINTLQEEQNVDFAQFILQKQIFGTEYSVDAYFDPASNFVDAVIRERIRVAGGEVITSKTLYNDDLYQISKLIGEKLKLIGPICFQYIIDKNTKPYLIEINARFGGGSTLSIEAGLDMISLIKKYYFNFNFDYQPKKWNQNLFMERYYMDSYFTK